MIDFSAIPPAGTVVGSIVDLGKPSFPTPKQLMAEGVFESIVNPEDSGAVVDLNIDGARRAIKLFEDGIAKMERMAAEIVVDTPEKAEVATEMAAQTLRLGDKIDARRLELIKIPDGYVRGVNSTVKPMQDRIKAVAGKGGVLKRKLSDYQTRVMLEMREIEKKQRDAAARLQAELDAEAKAKNIAPVTVAPVAIPVSRGPIRSASGSSSSKMVTIAEVTDLSAVPRNYLEAIFKKKSDVDGDDQLDGTTEAIWSRLRTVIMEAHTAGLREIAGVSFREKADVSVRRVG